MNDLEDDRTKRGAGFDRAMQIWQRRKWLALVVFVTVLSGVVSLAVWLPDLYRATATILVESQQISEEFVRRSVTSELGTRIQRIRQEVMSRGRLGDLITDLDLYPDLRKDGVPFDAIVEQMRRDVELEPIGVDPQMGGRGPAIAFAISYSGRDPETVTRVANTIAAFYIEEHTRMRAGQAARTAEFLKTQLAQVKRELDAQERRASDFKLQHLGELPQQIEANLGSLERLNTQLRLNAETQIRALDRRDRLEDEMARAEAAPGPAPILLSPHAAQLARLKSELSELRRQFSDVYPDVIRLRAEIAAVEQQDAGQAAADDAPEPRAVPGTRHAQALGEIESELSALKQEELRLRSAIVAYEARVENVPRRQEEFDSLSRDYATTKERHDTLLKRYEEAQLAESMERGQQTEQLRVLDPAIAPRNPAAPARLRLIAVGLILSLVLAAGALVAAEYLDTSFHTIDELQAAVPRALLFSIPLIETSTDRHRYWRRVALTTASVVVGLALIVAGFRYVATGNERVARLVARGNA